MNDNAYQTKVLSRLQSISENTAETVTALKQRPDADDSGPATRSDLSRWGQRLEDLIVAGQEAALKQIDEETNAIAKQLEEIAANVPNADQAERLRAHAARLNGMGKTTTTSET